MHQGDFIKKKLEESDMSVARFAQKIGVTRAHVYHLYKQKEIKSLLYNKILEVLGLTQSNTDSVGEVVVEYEKTSVKKEELQKENEYLKQRIKDLETIIEAKNALLDKMK